VVFAPHPGLFDKVLLGYAGPVSIFESRASYKASDLPDFATNKRAFSFHIDEVAAGEHVGRFLSRCGYRRPVFISAHADWRFSAQRLEGLSVAYRGGSGGRDTPRTVFHGGKSAAILNKAAAVARAELPDIAGAGGQPRDGELLRRLLEDSSPSRYRFMEIYERVLSDELAPLFKQALLERGDVWVCVNDQEAVQALRFLRHNRTRVPADLGVIAFDNTDEASYAGLSSYDFDMKGLVPRMLDVVLRPGAQLSADVSRRVFVHTGMVVQRASLAVKTYPGPASTK
jgi:DNA-binding LacI/PurR family transcriptional regulator